ncbi:uncharacterized protein LOC111289034 [Durio zibethinus]|uniref:Uncharacterized protein LOC111289034 n=1 Tax=Durio zibethinus TaxID=66656 RepID=A0A6P5Y5D4_DURZI|nr:uncharacterized protein LOC111289034 [Durio zibethinus]
MKRYSFPGTKLWKKPCCVVNTTRQHQCIQTTTTAQKHSTNMASSVSHNTFSMIPFFVAFLVFASSLGPVLSLPLLSDSDHRQMANHTFKPAKGIQKLRRINAYLKRINKPAVKTIQASSFSIFPLKISASLF